MATLKNSRLTVTVDPLGAQMTSVRSAEGTEYIWQADPAVWGRHAPLLFPFIGRLKDGQYTVDGRPWSISSHGFARDSMFRVVEECGERAVFRLESSPETREHYPFDFILDVTYTLEENRLIKSCTVKNCGAGKLYFELGGHDGFRAPLEAGERMDDYAVVFPGMDELLPYGMNEKLMVTEKTASFPLESGRVPLKPSVYGLDTITLDSPESHRAMLVDGSGRPRVTLEFRDFPFVAVWSKPSNEDVNYVCIEPWSALPDGEFVGRGIEDKRGIAVLEPGEEKTLTYTTTFA